MKKLFLMLGGLLSLCGCTGLEALDFIVPHTGYSVTKDIPYGDNPRQHLDVYTPTHPASGHPVIVFWYGGSWQSGRKQDYRFVAQAFASKGFYTVIADYRLYPEVYFPTFMQDSAKAFVWVHSHIGEYGGNVDNLFVSGHSSGAYNAIMLTLNQSYLQQAGGKGEWIKGAIGIAGPYDFLPFSDPKIIALFSKERDADTQPINYVRAHLPPMLLLTGDADTDVLPRNAYHMEAKLKQYGDKVSVHTYPSVAHKGIILAVVPGFRSKAPTLDDIADFVSANVK